MELIHSDQVFRVAPDTQADYNRGNTLIRLLTIEAMDRGELVVRNDLIQGARDDFAIDGITDKYLVDLAPNHTLHPILPLHIECAWADATTSFWDSRGGANHHYEFSMIVRGWDKFLSAGISPNPHGGIGLHRHRDNQEICFLLEGQAYMIVDDWSQRPWRERAFELRTLRAGHFTMLKGGQLHGLMNPGEQDISLFMFGGYD